MPVSAESRAEAARYALLRRLAPSMRHHLVVNLQPIGMICEVMDRRLRAPAPDLGSVHDSAHKINGFARAALDSCLDVVGWLAPDDAVSCTVQEAATECAGLLATSLGFRGFALRNQVAIPGAVKRSAIRHALAGSLICLTDELSPPAELLLDAEEASGGARISLRFQPTEGERGFVPEAAYRPLAWDDLQALAEAEGITAERDGERCIVLVVPWMTPAGPAPG
jgi:hypothetical protein